MLVAKLGLPAQKREKKSIQENCLHRASSNHPLRENLTALYQLPVKKIPKEKNILNLLHNHRIVVLNKIICVALSNS